MSTPIAVGIDSSWSVDFGQICDGDTVSFKICNADGGTHTATIQVCGCPNFSFPTSTILNACECKDITGTFTGSGFPNNGSCLVIITFNGKTSLVTIRWQEVYCEPVLSQWKLSDTNEAIRISSDTFSADCDIFTMGAMGEAKTISLTYTVTQPLVPGDELFISQWLFAQLPDWRFQSIPDAGWKYRVCLHTDPEHEEPTVDGTFNMEWYGQQPSEENSQNTPFVSVNISGGGTTIVYAINFNLPQDTVREPGNVVIDNHRQLLANTIQNENELNNQAENSIYRNYKYLSWASVIYRSVGQVFQDSIFSLKGTLPFYGENVTGNACVFRLAGITLTTPTTQATDYLSTVRATSVRVDFSFADSNLTGTPPDDMWVYLIRNDSRNSQLDYYQNYEYEQADLTNSVASANITPVTVPTNITGTDFYAEFDVSALRTDLTGVENISNNYRFIFVVHSTIDMACRSDVTEPIQLINYSDENLTLTGVNPVFRTVEQEYPTAVRVLSNTCVNMNLETVLRANLALLDSEVSAKSGGLIPTALEAFQSAELKIYDQSPLTGNTLLNVEYFNAEELQICGAGTGSGLLPFVNKSSGNNIDLTFPFTIPDNVYRNIGREGLYQSDASEPTDWGALSLASLSCVQNREAEQCDVLFPLPDVSIPDNPNSPNLNGIIYIPEINQIWGCDSANDLVYRIDRSNNTVLSSIALTAGDLPAGLIQAGNKVFVSCSGGSNCRVINIYTQVVTNVSGITGVALQRFALTPSGRLYCTCFTSNNVIEINPLTEAQVGGAIAVGTNPIDIIYQPDLDQLFVGCFTSNDVYRIDNTNAVVGLPIALTGSPFRLCASKNLGVPKVLAVIVNTIAEIDITSFAVTNYVVATGQLGSIVYREYGIIYLLCNADDNLCLLDSSTYVEFAEYPSGDAPRDLVFAGNELYVSNGNSDNVTPYTLDCNDSLPPFTMANRNILFNWDLTFKFFDNTETYTIQQKLVRPSPSRVVDNWADFDNIIIEEYQDDPTPIQITTICPTTNPVKVTLNLTNPVKVMSVGVELQPIRGGVFSSKSSASPISIPSDSPYITNLSPAYGLTTQVTFDLDVPSLPIQGDYSLLLHFIAQ